MGRLRTNGNQGPACQGGSDASRGDQSVTPVPPPVSSPPITIGRGGSLSVPPLVTGTKIDPSPKGLSRPPLPSRPLARPVRATSTRATHRDLDASWRMVVILSVFKDRKSAQSRLKS